MVAVTGGKGVGDGEGCDYYLQPDLVALQNAICQNLFFSHFPLRAYLWQGAMEVSKVKFVSLSYNIQRSMTNLGFIGGTEGCQMCLHTTYIAAT